MTMDFVSSSDSSKSLSRDAGGKGEGMNHGTGTRMLVQIPDSDIKTPEVRPWKEESFVTGMSVSSERKSLAGCGERQSRDSAAAPAPRGRRRPLLLLLFFSFCCFCFCCFFSSCCFSFCCFFSFFCRFWFCCWWWWWWWCPRTAPVPSAACEGILTHRSGFFTLSLQNDCPADSAFLEWSRQAGRWEKNGWKSLCERWDTSFHPLGHLRPLQAPGVWHISSLKCGCSFFSRGLYIYVF